MGHAIIQENLIVTCEVALILKRGTYVHKFITHINDGINP